MVKTSKFLSSFALASLVYNLVFPQFAAVGAIKDNALKIQPLDGLITFNGQALIENAGLEIQRVVDCRWVTVTAYSSSVDQCDSTPFITACGTRVRDGIVACNFLKFGARVRFPELYGEKVFTVEDRMALKNSHKIDIWFPTRLEAKQFGVKTLKVEVLES